MAFDMQHHNLLHLVLPRDKTGDIEIKTNNFGGFGLTFFLDLNGVKLKIWTEASYEPTFLRDQLASCESVSVVGRFGGSQGYNGKNDFHAIKASTTGVIPKDKVLEPKVYGTFAGQVASVDGSTVRIAERTRNFKTQKTTWRLGTVQLPSDLPSSMIGRYIQVSGSKLIVGTDQDPSLGRFEPCLITDSVALGGPEKVTINLATDAAPVE